MSLPVAIELDPVVEMTIRVAGAVLFLTSALPKLRDFAAFRRAVSGYALLPESVVAVAAALLLTGEIAAGVALLTVHGGGGPLLAAAGLLGVYTVAIAINLARGRHSIDCGCGGPGVHRPLSGGLVARNVALIAVALLALVPAAQRSWLWVDTLTVVACTGALALVYAAAEIAASHSLAVSTGEAR